MRPTKPRPVCIYHRAGRNRPLAFICTMQAESLHHAIVTFAALSCYDVRELRACFA